MTLESSSKSHKWRSYHEIWGASVDLKKQHALKNNIFEKKIDIFLIQEVKMTYDSFEDIANCL